MPTHSPVGSRCAYLEVAVGQNRLDDLDALAVPQRFEWHGAKEIDREASDLHERNSGYVLDGSGRQSRRRAAVLGEVRLAAAGQFGRQVLVAVGNE